MKPRYVSRDRSIPVGPNSPDRLIWIGSCGYWTDDWAKLKGVGIETNGKRMGKKIPLCPLCELTGVVVTARLWFTKAEVYQATQPVHGLGYVKWLNDNKERCIGHTDGLLGAYLKERFNVELQDGLRRITPVFFLKGPGPRI